MKPAAWVGVGLGIVVIGGGLVYTAGKFARQEVARVEAKSTKPKLTTVEPADGAIEVSPVTGIKAGVSLPSGAGVDDRTLAAGVHLVRTKDGQEVAANRNTSGAGDDVVLVPTQPLELNTQYTVQFTADLKDTAGVSFDAKTVSFTTAKAFAVSQFPAAFERVDLPATVQDRDAFTALAIGPDGLLYAGTFAGMIHRYAINPDGTLTPRGPIMTVLKANHGPRLITGITFDPKATAENPVLWITHGQFAMKDGRPEGADDWTGKLSYLYGPQLEQYQDVLVGLPRAYKDHLTFCPAFGPDGAIYLSQGSNTSVGDIDVKWGYRPERKLTAAILRMDLPKIGFDISRLAANQAAALASRPGALEPDADRDSILLPVANMSLPLDVKTEDGGTYDPAAPNAPLTLYATGVRSGFRLLWHRNGHVYTGVNGAAGNEGNTPASPDGKTPAIRDIKQTTDDLLLKLTPARTTANPTPRAANTCSPAATRRPGRTCRKSAPTPSARNPTRTTRNPPTSSVKTTAPTAWSITNPSATPPRRSMAASSSPATATAKTSSLSN
ncbi:MAG: Ig-like domain-containing protein [Tepidisphaeraceae bacterium]